jgi:hypothetical protein
MNLYEIKNEYLRAFDELSKIEGLDPQIIQDSLAAIDQTFEEKALNVCAHIKNLETKASAMKTYEERMADRRLFLENKIKRLKEYVLVNLNAAQKKKIEGVEFDVSVQTNPPKVIIDDESKLGPQWFVTEEIKTLDKKALKCAIQEAAKNNETIPGAHLEQGVSLQIK